jgi:hypothetical protein
MEPNGWKDSPGIDAYPLARTCARAPEGDAGAAADHDVYDIQREKNLLGRDKGLVDFARDEWGRLDKNFAAAMNGKWSTSPAPSHECDERGANCVSKVALGELETLGIRLIYWPIICVSKVIENKKAIPQMCVT